MQLPQPVDMPAAAAHPRPEVLLVGCCIKLRMEFIVGSRGLLEVARLCELLLAGDGLVEFGDKSRVMADGQRPRFQFHCLPQEM